MASTNSVEGAEPHGQVGIHRSNTNELRLPPGTLRRRTRAHRSSHAQQQEESLYKASAIVPFSRDPDFVKREELLDIIQEKCAVPGSRTALVGLGGVGKSQLAIEFAYQVRERSPSTWVFWVHTSNAARFEQSFQNIATHVKIPGRQSPDANSFQLVHDWLCDEDNGRWLVILDNVDDANFLLKTAITNDQTNDLNAKAASPLISYLPQCQNGSILITSRNITMAMKLAESRNIIMVDPMSQADASALLHRKLGTEEDSNDVSNLATALEYMPLAMVQAAAYISQRKPRYSVKQYLKDFQKSETRSAGLLDFEAGQLRRDWEAKNSILITWQISFDYIRQTRPSAADLLALMSFFDRQGIPEALLRNKGVEEQTKNADLDDEDANDGDGNASDSVSASSQDFAFDQDVHALREHSFISVRPDGITFEMHRLVQLATRRWLESNRQLEQWKKKFVRNLWEQFPVGYDEKIAVYRVIFPHIRSALGHQPENKETLEEWAALLCKASLYASELGSLGEAEEMALRSFKARETMYGQKHSLTMKSLVMVAQACSKKAQWKAAEELQLKILEWYMASDEVDPLDMAIVKSDLSNTYFEQGRWYETEKLDLEVIETYKAEMGLEHHFLLTLKLNLAAALRKQGRWVDAEDIQVEVMNIRKRLLGEENPNTLFVMSSLAATYLAQSRIVEAKDLGTKVLELQKKTNGEGHLHTLGSMAIVASAMRALGEFDQAEQLYLQVIDRTRTLFGSRHPDTVGCISGLAQTYQAQGKWELSEELLVQILEARAETHSEAHPHMLTSKACLAETYMGQGKLDAAENRFKDVLAARTQILGPDHPSTLLSTYKLALCWKEQGRKSEAIDSVNDFIERGLKIFGPNHKQFLEAVDKLAAWEKELEQVDISDLSIGK